MKSENQTAAIGARAKQLLEERGGVAAFIAASGFSKGRTYYNFSSPTLSFALKVLELYPVRSEWLFFGEGAVWKADSTEVPPTEHFADVDRLEGLALRQLVQLLTSEPDLASNVLGYASGLSVALAEKKRDVA